MNAKIGIFWRWNEIGSSFMRCLVTMFYKVEMLKTAAVGNWKRKLYVVAKKWQQLNERSNQISQVSPICILDIQIKVMFKKHSLKIYGPFIIAIFSKLFHPTCLVLSDCIVII